MRPSQNECLMTGLHSSPGTLPACNYHPDPFSLLFSSLQPKLYSAISVHCWWNMYFLTSNLKIQLSRELKRASNHDPKISKQCWSNYCFMTPSSMTLHQLRAIEFTNSSFSSLDNCFINGELGTLNQSVLHVITLYVSMLLPLTHTFFFKDCFQNDSPHDFFFKKSSCFLNELLLYKKNTPALLWYANGVHCETSPSCLALCAIIAIVVFLLFFFLSVHTYLSSLEHL